MKHKRIFGPLLSFHCPEQHVRFLPSSGAPLFSLERKQIADGGHEIVEQQFPVETNRRKPGNLVKCFLKACLGHARFLHQSGHCAGKYQRAFYASFKDYLHSTMYRFKLSSGSQGYACTRTSYQRSPTPLGFVAQSAGRSQKTTRSGCGRSPNRQHTTSKAALCPALTEAKI